MPSKEKRPQRKRTVIDPADGALLSPRFKLIFSVVTRITTVCLFGYIVFGLIDVFFHSESAITSGLLETFRSTFTLGFGAILGLLGGKAVDSGSV
jgi:hypothetical protein